MNGVIVSEHNIHVTDSAFLAKAEFGRLLDKVVAAYPSCSVVVGRSHGSMVREWAVHTLLYKLHLFRSRTNDVDLNYPQRWWESLSYDVLGALSLLFLK